MKYIYTLLLLLFASACAPISKTQPVSYIDPTTGMEFVAVPAGTFLMGDATGKEIKALPQHQVTIPAFLIGMYEVTFDQYDLFCEATGRKKPDDNEWGRGLRPVINVTWKDANAFAQWLSAWSGIPVRLPTEAEWEYAARAGTTTSYWTGSKLKKGYAICSNCGSAYDNKSTAPVGSVLPNRWGVYDMSGNVAEWVLDDYVSGYEGAPTDGTARYQEEAKRKVQRGGAWNYKSNYLRSAARDNRGPDRRLTDTGFRLIIPSESAAPQK